MRIEVIDKKTGSYPDLEEIAIKEEWARGLVCCDTEGFAITENGTLILVDEYGHFAYCPYGRFRVTTYDH